MANFSDFYFESSTVKNRIYVRQWTPDAEPRGIVQIEHGIAEHIERYDDFARFLADNGFIVVGDDHLGHGRSIAEGGEQGFFAENDGWDYVVRDIDKLHDIMHEKYPELPYIFFGHSMGSFLVRTYIIKHPEKPDAVIISGTGHQPLPMVLGGYAMASAAVKLHGAHKIGDTLNSIAFGSYNKGYDNARTEFDWLSRDTANVDKYIADPLCGFVPTVSLFRDMMGGIRFVTNQKNIDRMCQETPVYFMSGDADPVGENGKGVTRAYNAFCRAGLHDVKMRLYPGGRHELLNETNREDIYKDVLDWINEKI